MGAVPWWPQSDYAGLRHRVLMSPSFRVTADCRVRYPDVCVLAANTPNENVPAFPPDLCIEILALDDGFSATMERLRQLFQRWAYRSVGSSTRGHGVAGSRPKDGTFTARQWHSTGRQNGYRNACGGGRGPRLIFRYFAVGFKISLNKSALAGSRSRCGYRSPL